MVEDTQAPACRGCKVSLQPYVSGRPRVWCGERCRAKWLRASNKACPVVACFRCGTLFHERGPKKYCTASCRTLHRSQLASSASNRECRNCGRIFRGPSNKKYCTIRCRNQARDRTKRFLRRLAVRTGDHITVFELGQRDGWRCHLCGRQVPQRRHRNRNNDPEIDHLVPISDGGSHTWDNVALAHRQCNNDRGCVGAAQLRMI